MIEDGKIDASYDRLIYRYSMIYRFDRWIDTYIHR